MDTTGTADTTEATMWGPCRDVALQREADQRSAGYDAETVQAALALTYRDCVAGERRMRVHSVYDDPASGPPAMTARSSPTLLARPQD